MAFVSKILLFAGIEPGRTLVIFPCPGFDVICYCALPSLLAPFHLHDRGSVFFPVSVRANQDRPMPKNQEISCRG